MEGILNLIGNTPVIELKNIQEKYHLKSKIYAKLELNNPTGSVKDRTALNLVKDAKEKDILKKDSILIEATSGNMGISLSFVSKRMGYETIIVMPDNMSLERRKLVELYGAKLILTDGKLGMQGAIDKVNELKKQNDKIISLNQFNNLSNKQAHHQTGKEILNQVPNIDIFINGIGSSGTISGVGEVLKQKSKSIKVIGVEPASSPLITKGYFGPHKIQGIGANFIPSIMNKEVIDEVRTVTDEDSYFYTKELATQESIICGISAGANLKIAIEIAKEQENKNIVIIIPDRGDRYYSMNL